MIISAWFALSFVGLTAFALGGVAGWFLGVTMATVHFEKKATK